MAKTKNKNSNGFKRRPWLALIIILVLAAAFLIGFKICADLAGKDKKEQKQEEPISETATTIKSNEEQKKVAEEPEGKRPAQYEGENPNNSETLTGAITYAGASPENDKLTIRINIDQYLGSGSCKLVLTSEDGQIITEQADIIASASTSTCKGFDIAFPGSGTWQISIELNSGDKTGTIVGEVKL